MSYKDGVASFWLAGNVIPTFAGIAARVGVMPLASCMLEGRGE